MKKFLGGSEEYVVETANELAKRNYEVVVYLNIDQSGSYGDHNGVKYLPHSAYTENTEKRNILIAFKAVPSLLGKRNIYVTNDVNDRAENFKEFDHVVGISNWHVDNLLGKGEGVKVIPLACHHERYISSPSDKIPKLCLYSSSPDRGLNILLNIWGDVYAKTGAELMVTYGGKFTQTIPGVKFLGFLSESEMESLYKKAQFWVHPCTGIELFCVSGYKAQIAGCIPVVIPTMALSETVKFGVKTTVQNYKEDLIRTIENPPEIPNEYKQIVLGRNLAYETWSDVTDQLEDLF